MNGTRSTGVARRLALAASLLVAVGSEAQAAVWPTPNQNQATVFVPGLPGQTMNVWVSVLGGNSIVVDQLYFFANGIGNPGVALGPAGPGTNPWFAAPNSTNIGQFQAGSELIFGVHWTFTEKSGHVQTGWVYSGDPTRNVDGHTKMNNWQNGPVPEDNGTTMFPGSVVGSGTTIYGFEDDIGMNRSQTFGDFNDLVFTVTASATPEPASMVLFASGLIGVAGVAARRRRKA
jgi:hypothetical protein